MWSPQEGGIEVDGVEMRSVDQRFLARVQGLRPVDDVGVAAMDPDDLLELGVVELSSRA